jgi:hypothetical protein
MKVKSKKVILGEDTDGNKIPILDLEYTHK